MPASLVDANVAWILAETALKVSYSASSRLEESARDVLQKMDAEFDVYDDVEIEDMKFDEDEQRYTYNCPCGDLFVLTVAEMRRGEQIARCPSCSLRIRVIYDVEAWCPRQSAAAGAPELVRA